MLRLRHLVAVALVAGALATVPAPPPAGATTPVHPHLLFDAADVPGLKTRVLSGEPKKAYELLLKKADAFTLAAYTDPAGAFWSGDGNPFNQNRMGSILEDLAFAYKLAGTLSPTDKYASKAVDYLKKLAANGWPRWNGYFLGAGDLAKGVALAFDWTYDWMQANDPTAIGTIVTSLMGQLPTFSNGVIEGWKLFGCLDPDWNNASLIAGGDFPLVEMNWGGVCAGGVGLLALAIKDESGVSSTAITTMLQEAYKKVKNYVGNTFGNGSGATDGAHSGDNVEGLGYAAYGSKNAIPFGFAWTHMGMSSTAVSGTGNDPLAEPGTEGLDEFPINLAFEQVPGEGNATIPRNDSEDRISFMTEVLPFFFKIRPDGLTAWIWDHTAGPDGDDLSGHPPVVYHEEEEQPGTRNEKRPRSSEVAVILYYKTPTELPRVDPATVAGLGRHYSKFGLVDMRTGFVGGGNEVAVTFEAKRNHDSTRGHWQRDVGSFTLYGYGANLAIDSGYGHVYDGCPQAEQLQTGCGDPPGDGLTAAGKSIGHNVMQVPNPAEYNGIDQGTNTQRGSLSTTVGTSNQTIPLFLDGAKQRYVQANLATAYSSTPPRATRNLLFSHGSGEPVFLAVADGLQRDTSVHAYEWRLNTDPGNAVSVTGQRFTITAPNGATMAGLATAIDNRNVLVQRTQSGGAGTGPPNSLALRSVDLTNTARLAVDHLAVMAVTPAGVAPANVSAVTVSNGNLVKATWLTGTAWFSSREPAVATVSTPGFWSDGAFAKVSEGNGESLLDNGTFVKAETPFRDYIRITGTGAAATVMVSGGVITVTGSTTGNTYTVYSPQPVTSVTVNGSARTPTNDPVAQTWSFTH